MVNCGLLALGLTHKITISHMNPQSNFIQYITIIFRTYSNSAYSFLAIFFLYCAHANAAACANNSTLINADCTSLSITNPNLSVLVNSGVTIGASGASFAMTLEPGAVNTSLINNGTIAITNIADLIGGNALLATPMANATVSSFSSIVNNGSILAEGTVGSTGLGYDTTGVLINNGQGIASLENTGTISGMSFGLLTLHSLGTLTNTGSIIGTGVSGIQNWGQIGTINNLGSIIGGQYGVNNGGTLSILNNAQGAGNANGALTYTGVLPTNYNIIINSPTSYGKLAVTSGTGTTAFGIDSRSTVSNRTYVAVLSGLTSSQVTNKSGTYGGYSWTLSPESGSSTIWDLIISGYVDPVIVPIGPSVANTNQSLVNTASALQGTYTLQNSVLANSFSYDCTVFGANDICISAGGRNTTVQAANGLNNTSALLIAAYRPHPNYRIGAYADQNLSVSNPGGTVNLGNNTPLIGLFAAWNERLDGTGTEVKVSAAYGQKNTTITRSVVGSGATASEAGSGSSTLNSQGTQLTAKYGFGVIEDLIVSPYVGVRYTQNNMAGYTESTSSSVTAPLTYAALNTNATTALAGVGASYKLEPQVTTFASAGVETDTNTANGTYSATNSSIGTLTPVNFNANPVKTRPTATVGAYYDIEKNQRLGITGIYRQEAYQAVSTTTVLATYTVGL